jgi:MFS family permease
VKTRLFRHHIERFLPPPKANFALHLSEGILASVGSGLVGVIILQVMLQELGYSMAALGFLSSLSILASILQVAAAPFVESVRRKKRLVLWLGIGQRIPLLIIALALYFVGRREPALCLALIAAAQVIGGLSVSVLAGPWMDVVAETVPPEWTGKLFGLRNSIASALGIASAAINAVVLAKVAFPGNYVILYSLAFLLMVGSWLLFALVDEIPAAAVRPKPVRKTAYFRDLLLVLRDDVRYRWYLTYQVINRIGGAAAGFYAMYATRHYGVSPAFAAGAFITASQTAAILGNLGFGAVAARIGYKRMMELGAVLQASALCLASVATSGYGFVAVMFLTGLGAAATSVGGMPFSMQLFPRGRRVGYLALSALVMLPVGFVVANGTGLLLDRIFTLTFSLGAIITLTSIIALERCRGAGEGAGAESTAA